LCAGTALVADDFIFLALADKWRAMVPLLQVLCLFGLIRSLDVLLPPVLFARYRAAFMFRWTAGLLLVMPLAFWAGAAWQGALGVALALLVVYPVITAWMAHEALKELELGWKAVWHQLRPMLGATLLMGVVVLAVRWAMPASDSLDRLARLVLAVGSGVLVYTLAILRWGGPLVHEIADVAAWLLPRRALPTVVE
jgi:lipopolysaccharide exporter